MIITWQQGENNGNKKIQAVWKVKAIGLDNKLDGGSEWGNTEKEGKGKKNFWIFSS